MNKLFYVNINQIRPDDIFKTVLERLSDSRLEKVNRCALFNDKLRSAAAGLLLDHGLNHINLSEKTVEFTFSEHGKPAIKGHPEINFSISHSGDFVVCAFSDSPVGVDIERVKNIKPSLVRYACDEEEIALINSYDHSDSLHDSAFFDIWTKKESFLKYLGIGLTVRPAEISEKFRKELACVTFYSYDIAPGYRCTLCTEGEKSELVNYNIDLLRAHQ